MKTITFKYCINQVKQSHQCALSHISSAEIRGASAEVLLVVVNELNAAVRCEQ